MFERCSDFANAHIEDEDSKAGHLDFVLHQYLPKCYDSDFSETNYFSQIYEKNLE